MSKKKIWYRKMVENARCYSVVGVYPKIKHFGYQQVTVFDRVSRVLKF